MHIVLLAATHIVSATPDIVSVTPLNECMYV